MKIILEEKDIKCVYEYLESLQYKISAPLISFLNSKIIEEKNEKEKNEVESKDKLSKK